MIWQLKIVFLFYPKTIIIPRIGSSKRQVREFLFHEYYYLRCNERFRRRSNLEAGLTRFITFALIPLHTFKNNQRTEGQKISMMQIFPLLSKRIQMKIPAWWPAACTVCAHELINFGRNLERLEQHWSEHTILPTCSTHFQAGQWVLRGKKAFTEKVLMKQSRVQIWSYVIKRYLSDYKNIHSLNAAPMVISLSEILV